jgi:hypothetical protein
MGSCDCSSHVVKMPAAGSNSATWLKQLLTASITPTYPLLLYTRQHLSASSINVNSQLFGRLHGATGPMKLPVQLYVVAQPAGWDPALYVLSRAPQQQLPVTHINSSVLETAGPPGAGLGEVPAAALPTMAAGPDSTPLGPFLAYISRCTAGGY